MLVPEPSHSINDMLQASERKSDKSQPVDDQFQYPLSFVIDQGKGRTT